MSSRNWLGVMVVSLALAGCERVNVATVSSDLACDIDYVAIKATEMIEIESGLSIYKRFVLDELSEDDLSALVAEAFSDRRTGPSRCPRHDRDFSLKCLPHRPLTFQFEHTPTERARAFRS